MKAMRLLTCMLAMGCADRALHATAGLDAGPADVGIMGDREDQGAHEACTPGAFVRCDAADAVLCNEGGTDVVLVACSHGCNASAAGCNECDPGQVACDGDRVVTCSVEGLVVASSACEYGCDDSVTPPGCRGCASCAACPGDMVLVEEVGACIDRYEASPAGTGFLAASLPGAMPWIYVTHDEAALACAAAGKRLCTVEEWVAACHGPARTRYPYADEYRRGACNLQDQGINAPVPAGTFAGCEGGYPGLFDMTGNVEEWTATCSGDGGCKVWGGSFASVAPACSDDYLSLVAGWRSEYLGFRCCRAP